MRETERRARAPEGPPGPRRGRRPPLAADAEEALGAAEEALSAALGQEVRVRPRGERYRVELELTEPREAIELAERILRSHPPAAGSRPAPALESWPAGD